MCVLVWRVVLRWVENPSTSLCGGRTVVHQRIPKNQQSTTAGVVGPAAQDAAAIETVKGFGTFELDGCYAVLTRVDNWIHTAMRRTSHRMPRLLPNGVRAHNL